MKKYHATPRTLLCAPLTASLLTASSFAVWADETAAASAADSSPLDTIVVTATRSAQPVSASLASTTVLDSDDIARLQAPDLFALLEHVPGVTVARNGGYGGVVSVYLRGTSTVQTLFLVDGQRINSATLGQPNLLNLNPDQIERIEVVRGPRASLYGADAVGGVIQIFTKQASAQTRASASAGFGSHGLQEHRLSGSTAVSGNTRVTAGVSYVAAPGIDATTDGLLGSGDRDAWRNGGINLGLEHDIGTAAGITLQYLRNRGQYEYDSSGGCSDVSYNAVACRPYSNTEYDNLSATGKLRLSPAWNMTLTAGHLRDADRGGDDLHNDPTQVFNTASVYETTRNSLLWQNDVTLAPGHTVNTGIDYYQDKVDGRIFVSSAFGVPASASPYLDEYGRPVHARDNRALFAQYQGDLAGWQLVAGLRNDDNEKYGSNTTGNLALGIPLAAKYRLIPSFGTAFRAPSFNDLYWPGAGNPTLKPEKSKTAELRFTARESRLTDWEINLYQTRISDLIEWAPDPANPSNWIPGNVEEARITGLEGSVSTTVDAWTLRASAGVLQPEYTTTVGNANNGNTLVARPRGTAKLDLDRRFGAFSTGLSWMAEGRRYQDKANTQVTAGFALLDWRSTYTVLPGFDLHFRVANVFDRRYTTRDYSYFDASFNQVWAPYRMPGRTWFVSADYTFGK